jgi:hypothetical protein
MNFKHLVLYNSLTKKEEAHAVSSHKSLLAAAHACRNFHIPSDFCSYIKKGKDVPQAEKLATHTLVKERS